jgi:hypothetical protein
MEGQYLFVVGAAFLQGRFRYAALEKIDNDGDNWMLVIAPDVG